jgi:hypothetical protein
MRRLEILAGKSMAKVIEETRRPDSKKAANLSAAGEEPIFQCVLRAFHTSSQGHFRAHSTVTKG